MEKIVYGKPPPPEFEPPWDEIEPGIIEAVRTLWNTGLITFSSCEGGPGHNSRTPVIHVASGLGRVESDAHWCTKALIDAGYQDFDVSRVTRHLDSYAPADDDLNAYVVVDFFGTLKPVDLPGPTTVEKLGELLERNMEKEYLLTVTKLVAMRSLVVDMFTGVRCVSTGDREMLRHQLAYLDKHGKFHLVAADG